MQMKTLPRTFSTFQFNVRFRLVFSTKTRRQWKRLVHFTYPLTAAVAGAPQTTSQPVTFNSLFSIDLWDMANIRSVHSLMLPSHLFFCQPCLLPSFTVPCKMFLARPDERETRPYHCSLRLFTMVRSASGPIACRILARTFSLVYMVFV